MSPSSHGGLEVERLLHQLHYSTSVGLNTAWRHKDFRNNSNITGGAFTKKVKKHISVKIYTIQDINDVGHFRVFKDITLLLDTLQWQLLKGPSLQISVPLFNHQSVYANIGQ